MFVIAAFRTTVTTTKHVQCIHLETRSRSVSCFASRAVPFQLAVWATDALHAAVFHLAVGTRAAHRALLFQLAVGAAVAHRAVAFPLAVGARGARRAFEFQLAVRAAVAVHTVVFHLAVRSGGALHALAFLLPVWAPFYGTPDTLPSRVIANPTGRKANMDRAGFNNDVDDVKISTETEIKSAQFRHTVSVPMTTLPSGLKKYLERVGTPDAPAPKPGSKVHVHFTCTVRSSDSVIDSSRGEFVTEIDGITVRKCNMPLVLTLPTDLGQSPGVSGKDEHTENRQGTTGSSLDHETTTDDTHESNDSDAQTQENKDSPMIRGFYLAIASMQLGERSTFFVPSKLAYGTEGKGDVGPDEDLDFDLELVGVDGEYYPARK